MGFSAPLQGELSRKLLAVYETEGLLLRLVVVLFYNPSVIFFENATSPVVMRCHVNSKTIG